MSISHQLVKPGKLGIVLKGRSKSMKKELSLPNWAAELGVAAIEDSTVFGVSAT